MRGNIGRRAQFGVLERFLYELRRVSTEVPTILRAWRRLACRKKQSSKHNTPGDFVSPTLSLLYKTLHTVTEFLRLSFRPHTKIRAVWGFSPTVRCWYSLNLRRRMRPRIGALYE
jgi:hypothetical protein